MTKLHSNLQVGNRFAGGHFGEVHLGHDDVHGKVAVKVMRQRHGETAAEWQARKAGLLAEAQRLSQAEHQNVVRVFYLVQSDSGDAVHLVMRYCSGGSLQGPFEKGPLSLTTLRKYATCVAFGLQALHLRNMLHRDIKPGNILLDDGSALLGDFGLVTDDIILGYGSQAGYSDHLAPEIWNGSGTSFRTDVWALGMTIYRLLHGKRWYSSGPAPRTVIANGGFANSLRWLPHVPKEWRRFVRKMLTDDPHSRYQTAGEVVSALASLPVEPRWACKVAPNEISWQRKAKGRRIKVVWKRYRLRASEWSAWSEPVRSGNRRTLSGSPVPTSFAQCERELRAFFAKHR